MPERIQSLWVGNQLSRMERACIKSHIRNGHEFHLFVYEQIDGVPDGAIVEDAECLVPRAELSRFQNLANFSDYFRYMMLLQRGGYWVDLDVYCLKPFSFPEQYVLATQYERNGSADEVTSCVIKAPVGCDLLKYCLSRVAEIDTRTCEWSAIGPALLVAANERFGMQRFVKPSRTFCPLHYFEAPGNIFGRGSADQYSFGDEEYAIHLWREESRRAAKDRDGRYPDSLYERLCFVEGV